MTPSTATPSLEHSVKSAIHHLRTFLRLGFLPDSWRRHLSLVRSQRYQSYFVIAFTLWLVGAVEIIQKTGGQGLDPRFWMILAILITGYSGLRIFRLTPRAKLGSGKGAAVLNEMMGRLQANGLTVYYEPHQQKDGTNCVVVGESGIYALEVKSRNVFGSRTIEYRGQDKLVLGGRISDSKPLQRARAAAQQIREKLAGIPQTSSAVKPLVVFLDQWQINRPETAPEVPVVSAAELERYFSQQQPILSESEVAEVSACLG